MPGWLQILIAVVSVLTGLGTAGATLFAYLMRQNMRAEMAELRENITKAISDELKSFVSTQRFQDYSESHSKEHKVLDTEMVRLRDWKHNEVDPLLRKLSAHVADLRNEGDPE